MVSLTLGKPVGALFRAELLPHPMGELYPMFVVNLNR